MTKRYFGLALVLLLTIGLTTGGLVWAAPADLAQTYQNIAIDCPGIKTRLKQVKVSDDLTRVNYGQMYELIIKDLFIPANTRLVANRFDAGRLVNLTVNFETRLNSFRTDYQKYKLAMNGIQDIDCRIKPELFYDKLQEVRASRQVLRDHVAELDRQTTDYLTEFRLVTK